MTGKVFIKSRANLFTRRVLPVVLALSIVTTPFSLCAAASHKGTSEGVPGIKTIALFPANNTAGASGDVAADELDNALKFRLNTGGVYQGTSFSTLLPAIQTALNVDNTLTPDDVKPPVTDPTAAQKIARAMDTDGYLLDEVDSYTVDPKSHAVSVTVSGSLYSTKTGSAERTFAVTGTATPATPGEGEEVTSQMAVNSAAEQVVETLGVLPGVEKSEIPRSGAHQSAIGGSILLIALAAILAAVIIQNVKNNDHSTSSSTTSTTVEGSTGTTTTTTGSSGPPAPP